MTPKKRKTAAERKFSRRQIRTHYSGIIPQTKGLVNMTAKEKIRHELSSAKLSAKAKAVAGAIEEALCLFCDQNAEFAQAVEQSGTLRASLQFCSYARQARPKLRSTRWN